MATENTHSDLIASAGQTAAGEVTLGQIVLPAGGPWIIHHVFGLIARATATAGEFVGGYLRLDSASGDTTPNPAPSKFPLVESGSSLGATADASRCPLHLYETNYSAAGKAAINLIYNQDTALTVAPQIVAGIMFGKNIPEPSRRVFVDRVRVAQTAVADTAVGTITISENAKRITGVAAVVAQDNVLTAGEELIGYCRLASDDIDLTPMKVPFNMAFGAGLGALIENNQAGPVTFLPLDIPVTGGSRINAFVKLNTAVTNAAEVQLFLAYE